MMEDCGDKYMVLFGDLTAKNIAAEELNELENLSN